MSGNSNIKNLVPNFIVYLNGSRFTADQEASVKQITVNNTVDSISSFSISMSDTSRQWTDSSDLEEGTQVKIMVGYKDDVGQIINGEITSINPQFRMNNDDIVIVRGCNIMHRLMRGKKTRSFNEKEDVDIVKQMLQECNVKGDVQDIGSDHLFTMQHNQTDYEYLTAMIEKYDCRMYVDDKTLVIKKIVDAQTSDVVIEWGKSLLEFNIQTDTGLLLSEVEVRGWDNEKGEAVIGTSKAKDLKKVFDKNSFGGQIVDKSFGGAKTILVDNGILDQNGADELSLDIISNNSASYIHGIGKTEGNYKLNAGSIIEIKGLGTRFSGKYYIESVKHVFDTTAGYVTYFNVARNAT